MSQGKGTSWLRRGVAEFVVIVLGVLVALSVDQWAANRADRRAEGEYIAALVRDVQLDLAELDSVEAWSTRRELRVTTVLRFLRGEEEPSADSLLLAIEMAAWQRPFSMSTYTIDELRSTGSLRLIRDSELRRTIAAYYKDMELHRVVLDNARDRIWGWVGEEIHPRVLMPADRLLGARLGGRMDRVAIAPFPEDHVAPTPSEFRRRFAQVQEAEAAFGDALIMSRMIRNLVAQMRPKATKFLAELKEYGG